MFRVVPRRGDLAGGGFAPALTGSVSCNWNALAGWRLVRAHSHLDAAERAEPTDAGAEAYIVARTS
jgi:hypothetical protein